MNLIGLFFSVFLVNPTVMVSDSVSGQTVSVHSDSISTHVDSAAVAHVETENHEKKGGAGFIIEHVVDSDELDFPLIIHEPIKLPKFAPIHIGNFELDLSPTKHIVYLGLVSILLLLTGLIAGKVYRKNTSFAVAPKGFTNLVEVLVEFVRDNIAIPSIGKDDYKRFMPFLLTLFFFVLISNYLGLLPYGLSITGNINITVGLALITFVTVHVSSRSTYWHHIFLPDVPWWLYPIMVPVEIFGVFTKPFALAVRLFANMTGGHLVILTFIGLIFILQTHLVAIASIPLALFVYGLELIVGLIQAYIFTMLSAVYIGMAVEKPHAAHH